MSLKTKIVLGVSVFTAIGIGIGLPPTPKNLLTKQQ